MRFVTTAKTLALLVCCIASQGAFAASTGTITFTGKIVENTCEIDGVSVVLPNVSASSLASPGQVQGETQFKLAAKNCPASATKVGFYFQAGTTGDLATNSYKTNLQNVNLQVLSNGNPITLSGGAGSAVEAAVANGLAERTFTARYYALGQAATGDVNANVLVALTYP